MTETIRQDEVAAAVAILGNQRVEIFKLLLNEAGVMVAPGEEADALRRYIAQTKAALSAPVSEPVAWRYAHPDTPTDWRVTDHDIGKDWPMLVVQPLYTRPAPATGSLDREAVARIVDPRAWEFADRHRDNPVLRAEIKHETRASLAKADAILALPSSGTEGEK